LGIGNGGKGDTHDIYLDNGQALFISGAHGILDISLDAEQQGSSSRRGFVREVKKKMMVASMVNIEFN